MFIEHLFDFLGGARFIKVHFFLKDFYLKKKTNFVRFFQILSRNFVRIPVKSITNAVMFFLMRL